MCVFTCHVSSRSKALTYHPSSLADFSSECRSTLSPKWHGEQSPAEGREMDVKQPTASSLAGEDHLSSPSSPGRPALAGSVTPAGPPVLPPPECLMFTVNRLALPASLTKEAPGEGEGLRSLSPEKGRASLMREAGTGHPPGERPSPHTQNHLSGAASFLKAPYLHPRSGEPPGGNGRTCEHIRVPRTEVEAPPSWASTSEGHRVTPGKLHTVFPQAKAGPSGPEQSQPASLIPVERL